MKWCSAKRATHVLLFFVIPSGIVSDLVSSHVGLVAMRDYPSGYYFPYFIRVVSDLVSSHVV